MAKLIHLLLLALALVALTHANARNIPIDNPTTTQEQVLTNYPNPNPSNKYPNALAPVQDAESITTSANSPSAYNGIVDEKNFIAYGGMGGWGGVGGWVGVVPIFGGLGGLAKVGGIGAAGGVGGVGGVVGGLA